MMPDREGFGRGFNWTGGWDSRCFSVVCGGGGGRWYRVGPFWVFVWMMPVREGLWWGWKIVGACGGRFSSVGRGGHTAGLGWGVGFRLGVGWRMEFGVVFIFCLGRGATAAIFGWSCPATGSVGRGFCNGSLGGFSRLGAFVWRYWGGEVIFFGRGGRRKSLFTGRTMDRLCSMIFSYWDKSSIPRGLVVFSFLYFNPRHAKWR